MRAEQHTFFTYWAFNWRWMPAQNAAPDQKPDEIIDVEAVRIDATAAAKPRANSGSHLGRHIDIYV